VASGASKNDALTVLGATHDTLALDRTVMGAETDPSLVDFGLEGNDIEPMLSMEAVMELLARSPLEFGNDPYWVDDPDTRRETESRLKYLLALLIPMMGARFRFLIDGETVYEPDPAMDAYIAELVTTQIDLINDTTKNRVEAAIAKILDDAEGKTIEELTTVIEEEIGKILIDAGRTEAIAGDISVGVFGWTALDVAKQAGVKSMMWMTQMDAKVRFTHAAMQGQVRAPGDLFESPSGGSAPYPGGFNDPAEDCNCRCLLWPEIETRLRSAADTLYVRRNLTAECANQVRDWAKAQGIPNLVPPDQLHVTIVYSRGARPNLVPLNDQVCDIAANDRSVGPLGDKGAFVLFFNNQTLQNRWDQANRASATWDYETGYRPHVTLTYDAEGAQLSGVKPFTGRLIFGPEIHEPINEDWATDSGFRAAGDDRYQKLNAIRLIAAHRIKPLFQGMFQMQKAAFLGSIKTGRMVSALNLDAASLNIPDTPGHPNKMPFTGILTRVGVPSDGPPEGSGGKRVVISHDCAVKALPTLLGMAIDYVPNLDGHDPTRKIGIIEEANLVGDAISISGFIYAADFPQVAAEVKVRKHELGFSYEASQVWAQDANADPLVVVDCIFTGAALLLKKKAAYQTTSFSAKAAGEAEQEIDMTPEELNKMVSDAVAAALPGALSAAVATLRAEGDVDAAKMVRKHSAAIRKCAADMEAAGIGKHATKGHANLLRCAADDMDAQAASGTVPHAVGALPGYFDADDVDAARQRARRAKARHKADDDGDVDADDEEADDADMDADDDGDVDADDDGDQDAGRAKGKHKASRLEAQNKALKKQIKNLQSGGAQEPERKTISPSVMQLLARTSLSPELDKGGVLSADKVNEALKASGLTPEQRMMAKIALERAGRLA
jgi:hypothetical protein